MTVIEYAEKLGIELTDSQKGMLNIWQESDNKSAMFILSMPRCEGRQMIYDLIQRYRGYEQGRADAVDELCSRLKGTCLTINPHKVIDRICKEMKESE